MWLITMLIHILHRRFLVINYHMILIRQLNKTHGMVVFIPFHYIVYLNIFHQILKISKNPFVASLTTLKTRVLITLKQITSNLNGIDRVAWSFISAIYKLGWNTLVTNKDNRTFRQQVVSKFMPKIQKTKNFTKDDKLTDKPVSFAKLLLLIPMK